MKGKTSLRSSFHTGQRALNSLPGGVGSFSVPRSSCPSALFVIINHTCPGLAQEGGKERKTEKFLHDGLALSGPRCYTATFLLASSEITASGRGKELSKVSLLLCSHGLPWFPRARARLQSMVPPLLEAHIILQSFPLEKVLYWIILFSSKFFFFLVVKIHDNLPFFFLRRVFVFGCTKSVATRGIFHIRCGMWDLFKLWHMRPVVVTCELFSCIRWDLVPWPGIEPRAPALGDWNLSYWTTRQVPIVTIFKCAVQWH